MVHNASACTHSAPYQAVSTSPSVTSADANQLLVDELFGAEVPELAPET
jgi:hypothetical protein